MFDAVRNNKKIVQVFLGLITLPFAFWGVDSYIRNSGAGNDLASVGDTKITAQQFEQAVRERQDQLRQSLGESFNPEMMSLPEVRRGILNALVDQRLLLLEASKKRLVTGDRMLQDAIANIPALQDNGRFSMDRYESALRAQGMSQPQFEARMRQDMTIQQLVGAASNAAFVSTSQAEAMMRLQSEEREYGEFRMVPEQFADKVTISPAAVQSHYDSNKAQFEVPEQVKAEYLVLSLDTLLTQVKVTDAEVKAWYEGHKDRYQQPEERRASHILILANDDADKAKAKAEDVLKEVQKSPEQFAALAKKYSEDTGSAKNGGDLGFFGRGMMVKEFEASVFTQKEGEISGLVKSDFGYHIIKVTGIKPSALRPLEEVRPEIEGELQRQAASRKFAEAAEAFNNTVYEQSDSLQPAAEKFKLTIQKSDWIPKNSSPQVLASLGSLGNAKLVAALFSDDAVKDKRNTEAVEVAPSTLVAARVVEHSASTVKSFEAVKADIEKLLKTRESAALAKKSGEEMLASLRSESGDKLGWTSTKTVSRMKPGETAPDVLKTLFKADVAKLPAYMGAVDGDDYVIYKITKVIPLEKTDPAQLKALQREYGSIVAQEDVAAYLTGLRSRYKIVINEKLLSGPER